MPQYKPCLSPEDIQTILEYAPFGVLAENCSGEVVWINHTLGWQLGIDPLATLGTLASDLPLQPMFGARGKRWFQVSDGSDDTLASRKLKCIEDILPDNSDEGIRVRYFLEAPDDQPVRLNNDLLRLLNKRQRLDPGTGLRDCAGIIEMLRSEVSRSRRYGNPLSVIVLEICFHREFGTVINHPSRILMLVSRLLQESTRWADRLGRSDEREFLLVLPETDAEAAAKLVEKIEHRLRESGDDLPSSIDTHFGVAEWTRGDDPTTLLNRAKSELAITASS